MGGRQDVVVGSYGQDGTKTWFSFARKFVTGDSADAPIADAGTTVVLCAYGTDNTFGFHTGGYIARPIEIVVPPIVAVVTPRPISPPIATPTATPVPGARDFSVDLNGISHLRWSVDGELVAFIYTVQGLRWISFGVSAASGKNLMTGPPASDVVICKSGSAPQQYRTQDMVGSLVHLSDLSQSDLSHDVFAQVPDKIVPNPGSYLLHEPSCIWEGGATTLKFGRKFDTGSALRWTSVRCPTLIA